MAPTRREALAQLSAFFALPLADWTQQPTDPLHTTIVAYQAGRALGQYSAEEVTTRALAKCRAEGNALRAIDQLAPSALAEARASDARRARGALRGPLDGVPVFAKSIYDNVVYGLRIAGMTKRGELDEAAEKALTSAALWDEVKDRLHTSAFGLSGGQQQRLCIARVIATEPDVVLMDEPCAALDPLATLKIEELIAGLKKRFTIVIVTHNMSQATRCSDRTAFMYLGKLVEYGETMQIFESPGDPQTEAYITGAFG